MLSNPRRVSDLDLACDAALWVVKTRGLEALSVRAIAMQMNLTGPALTHRWDNKARLWRLLVSEVGDRWLRVLESAVRDRGLTAFVPSSDEEVDDTRLWLCFRDLGRSNPDLALRLVDLVEQERGLLRRYVREHHGVWLDDASLDLLVAVASGLRDRVRALAEPMPPGHAAVVWTTALDAIGTGQVS